MRVLDPKNPQNISTFARDMAGPVAVDVGPDGSLYYLNRNAWVKDEKWKPKTGSLYRIRYTGETSLLGITKTVRAQPTFAARLSQTGFFQRMQPLEPSGDFVTYEVNSPAWIPGTRIQRWLRLPVGTKIKVEEAGTWIFPPDTIFLKHFTDLQDRPVETQVFRAGESCFAACSYKWQGSDAELVEDSLVENIGHINWFFPGSDECVQFASSYTGYFFEIGPAQINREDQLKTWNSLKMFDPPLSADYLQHAAKMAALDNPAASDELKLRSYLSVNCSMCHFPNGPSRGNFDARFESSLRELIAREPLAGDLGIAGAKLVAPGDPEKSILLQRLKRFDIFRMPPASLNDIPSPMLPVLESWIRSLSRDEETR